MKDSDQKAEQLQATTSAANKANAQLPPPQAMQQWLHQIPDDPGGLLKQKFLRDHQRQELRKLGQVYDPMA